MPKINIDGKEIEFKQGQTIIEAAKDHGIEIAHFAGILNFLYQEIAGCVLLKLKKCQSL